MKGWLLMAVVARSENERLWVGLLLPLLPTAEIALKLVEVEG